MWCETMTSGERMGAVMRGERPDRVPVIPFVSGHTAVVCGQPLARMFDDAEESFRCQLLSQEMYGYDGGPLYAYASAGGWEFGGDIEFPVKKYSGATGGHPHAYPDRGRRLRAQGARGREQGGRAAHRPRASPASRPSTACR